MPCASICVEIQVEVEQPDRQMVTTLIYLNKFSCINTVNTVYGVSTIEDYVHESLD